MNIQALDLDALAAAVACRAGAVTAAARRLEGLAPAIDPPPAPPGPADHTALALRMLRTCGDPAGHRILSALDGGGLASGALAAATGLGPLELWEAGADLVQAGLVERDTAHDSLALTSAGSSALAVVAALSEPGPR